MARASRAADIAEGRVRLMKHLLTRFRRGFLLQFIHRVQKIPSQSTADRCCVASTGNEPCVVHVGWSKARIADGQAGRTSCDGQHVSGGSERDVDCIINSPWSRLRTPLSVSIAAWPSRQNASSALVDGRRCMFAVLTSM